MNKIYRVFENISLGLFVNGSYGLFQGDTTYTNLYVVFGSIYGMTLFIMMQEDQMDLGQIIIISMVTFIIITATVAATNKYLFKLKNKIHHNH